MDGIVEIVLGEIEVPSDGVDWKAALRQTAISSHEVFVRHRWACGLMMGTSGVSPARCAGWRRCSEHFARRASRPT